MGGYVLLLAGYPACWEQNSSFAVRRETAHPPSLCMMNPELEILLNPEKLLAVYAGGMFPMAPSQDSPEVYWFAPEERGILPLEAFHVSRNVCRWIRNHPHRIGVDEQFEAVMRACADRPDTWISGLIVEAYLRLHQVGHAHSVEVYVGSELVGGLYGVSLGAAFFGESMFKRAPEMDKVALHYCHRLLLQGGYRLWDTQYYTEHLGTLGAQEIPQDAYLQLLDAALRQQARFPRRLAVGLR